MECPPQQISTQVIVPLPAPGHVWKHFCLFHLQEGRLLPEMLRKATHNKGLILLEMSESAQVEESRLCPSDPLQSSRAKQQQRLRLGRARMDVHMVCSSHASGATTPAFHLGSLCRSCSLLSKSYRYGSDF